MRTESFEVAAEQIQYFLCQNVTMGHLLTLIVAGFVINFVCELCNSKRRKLLRESDNSIESTDYYYDYDDTNDIECRLLEENAVAPVRAHDNDAGLDIFALEKTEILPGRTNVVRTGVALKLPKGYYGQVHDRSSYATKKHMWTSAGVIDIGYRGEIRIAINTHKAYTISPGEKFCQIVLIRQHFGQVVVTEDFSEDSDDEDARGTAGFGSTGNNVDSNNVDSNNSN